MPKAVWFLIIGTFVNTVASSFLWPLNSIYIHDSLGKSLTMAGFVLMLNSLAAVFGNILGGWLFDKLGGYRSILIGVVLNLVTLVLLTLWHDWPQYIIFLTMLGFTGGIVFPAIYAMAGSAWPEGGRKAFNAIFLANNVGVAIGPSIAGLVADISFEYVFLTNLATYFIFFLIVLTTFKKIPTKAVKKAEQTSAKQNRGPIMAIVILSIALIGCWMSYSQWVATISPHTQALGMSLSSYSLIWTINGALIVLFQPIVRPLVRRWENKLKHQLVLGLVIMAASFAIIPFAGDFKAFAAAMAILTLGEVFFTPVIPLLASRLAPEGQEGFYQGFVNSATTMGRMIGPLFGGIMVDTYGMSVLAFVVVGILLLSTIPCFLYTKALKR